MTQVDDCGTGVLKCNGCIRTNAMDGLRRDCAKLFPFWEHLSAEQRREMLEGMVLRNFYKMTRAELTEVAERNAMWAVARGTVNLVMRDSEGHECRVLRLRIGDVACMPFDEMSFRYYVEALVSADTLLCVLGAGTVEGLIAGCAKALEFMTSTAANMVGQLLNLAGDVTFSPLRERLRRTLHEYASEQRCNEIIVTHEELANDLGTSREVITRLLREMSRAGAVALRRGRISLKGMREGRRTAGNGGTCKADQ